MFFGEACAGELWRCQWHCCLIRLQNPTKQHSLQGNLFTESSGEAVDILSCLEKSDLSNERISTYIASWLDTMFWTLYPPQPHLWVPYHFQSFFPSPPTLLYLPFGAISVLPQGRDEQQTAGEQEEPFPVFLLSKFQALLCHTLELTSNLGPWYHDYNLFKPVSPFE